MKKSAVLWIVLPCLAIVAGCIEASKSSNPLTPTVAGPIPGVNISQPGPVTPKDNVGFTMEQQPVTLTVDNAVTNGARPLTYTFDVATDADFTNKVFTRSGIASGEGRTSVKLPDPLGSGRTYYWHAKAEDGVNAGTFSNIALFNVFTPVVIGAPTPVSPINNTLTTNGHPSFVMVNAPRSGLVGAISYVLEISDTDSFASKVAVWTVGEQANQTTLNAPVDLPLGKQLFWHVRAGDIANTGPYSATHVFRTPEPPKPVPVPVPGGGSGSGGPCGPPWPAPLGIVQCERAKFGTPMGATNTVTVLKAVASDMNKSGYPGGPFGILQKSGGSNCNGYSCDIICSGQGNSQQQWDVFIDSDNTAGATFHGPGTVPGIRVDQCDIQP